MQYSGKSGRGRGKKTARGKRKRACLPKKVNLAGAARPIEYLAGLKIGKHDLVGLYIYDKATPRKIQIEQNLDLGNQFIVLVHELLHALWHTAKVNKSLPLYARTNSVEETVVEKLSVAIADLLVNNTKEFACLFQNWETLARAVRQRNRGCVSGD